MLPISMHLHVVTMTIVLNLTLFGSNGWASSQGFAPPPGKVLLLIGQNNESVDSYIQSTKIIPAGLMSYTSINELKSLDTPKDYGAGIQYADEYLTKYPNTVLQIGLYMVGSLENVVSGQYDENIRKLGAWIKKTQRPVYLRIGYEFDSPPNAYDPALYVQAFQRIVTHLRSQDVSNVAFVWHSAGFRRPGMPFTLWYPGDEYVDWVGISYFNAFNSDMKVFSKFAREHGKPFMIAEATPAGTGVHHGPGSWSAFYRPLFKFIRDENVQALSYINCNWDTMPMYATIQWGDSRIQENPVVRERWLAETGDAMYLKSSPQLFRELGWEK